MEFSPKILALLCTYCTYTAADMAGSARMQYPANVRIVKYLCTGRIDILHILKGFEAGADGVMVSGCETGSCHFLEGNLRARERVEYARYLLDECGLGADRLAMYEVAASDAPKWVMAVNEMTARIKNLGPSPLEPQLATMNIVARQPLTCLSLDNLGGKRTVYPELDLADMRL